MRDEMTDLPPPRVSEIAPLDIDHYPLDAGSWRLPPCLRCGSECAFSDGICAPCWRVYQEEIA